MMGSLGALIVKFNLPHASWLQVCLPLALIIGAVSAATAPAAVLAIVHECQARGPLTTTLLGVVALDDGMAIILYAFASSIVGALTRVQGISMIHKMAVEPLLVIVGSVLLGVIFGFFLTLLAAWVKKKGSMLVLILGSILFCAGIADQLKLSPLLASMMLGSYGLGENVVQGSVAPDEFYVFKPIFSQGFKKVLRRTLGPKKIKMIYAGGGTREATRNVPTPEADRENFCISDEEVSTLADYAIKVEQHYSKQTGYDKPMEMEWAKDGLDGHIYGSGPAGNRGIPTKRNLPGRI
jgi:hypothetical protein